ncbi:MAG: metallophosphoesterase [Oscillospiraceae bacterium]|nr:metallophosphoesterase [Oscillospiraceae bacterium]
MKILVISDSHGNTPACIQAVRLINPELILHLGDYDSDCAAILREFPDIPIKAVKGNCDPTSNRPEALEFEAAGKKFFITHGHLHAVAATPNLIVAAAKSKNTDVALFGHTHNPCYEINDGTVLVNPGSIGRPRPPTGKKTYAVLEIKNGVVSCEIKEL